MVIALRVLSGTCMIMIGTVCWLNMNPHVLKLLIQRPRVAYITSAAVIAQAVHVPLTYRSTEIFSMTYLAIGATTALAVLPLTDSIPGQLGRVICRLGSLTAVVGLGMPLAWCQVFPSNCAEFYHDYRWTTGQRSLQRVSNATVASNATSATAQPERIIFSMFDIYESCSGVLLVLCLREFTSSVKSPNHTNVIKGACMHDLRALVCTCARLCARACARVHAPNTGAEPMFLEDLHPGDDAEQASANVGSKLSVAVGKAAETLMSRWGAHAPKSSRTHARAHVRTCAHTYA